MEFQRRDSVDNVCPAGETMSWRPCGSAIEPQLARAGTPGRVADDGDPSEAGERLPSRVGLVRKANGQALLAAEGYTRV